MERDVITSKIIGAAIEVHRILGPGLLESTYESSLAYELTERYLDVQTQKFLSLNYKKLQIKNGYKIDLLVENKVIVEVKSVDHIRDVHRSQILTYMRLSSCKTGLLINFNVPLLKQGIERFIN